VTVSNTSLPPQFGAPKTALFLPGPALRKAQHALNANDIRRLAKPRLNHGCAGGYSVSIKIVKHNHAVVRLSGYRCAGTTYGIIGGNLPGFLKAVRITPP
jgi:hypothetical protein